jgi:hypothetical protein
MRDNVAKHGTVKPRWSLTGDSNLATDLADDQAIVHFYVTAPASQKVILHHVTTTAGDVVKATATVLQPHVTTNPPDGSSIAVTLACSNVGRSHVTVAVFVQATPASTTIVKALEFRFKKRCGGAFRPGLHVGTEAGVTMVKNGHVQPDHVTNGGNNAIKATVDQTTGLYRSLSVSLDQLSVGTAPGTQQYAATTVKIVPDDQGTGTIVGPFAQPVVVTQRARHDLNVKVLCRYNSINIIEVQVTLHPSPVYQPYAPTTFSWLHRCGSVPREGLQMTSVPSGNRQANGVHVNDADVVEDGVVKERWRLTHG